MAGLTTHILDTHSGVPAKGVTIELFSLGAGEQATSLGRFVTNADGRTDRPVLDAANLKQGRYELRFHIGDYFRARGAAAAEPLFLDIIPIRFGVADTAAHYHVPLLASPWSFSTYRGS